MTAPAVVRAARAAVVDWNLRLVRGLPDPVARDRVDEVLSDLWEQGADAERRGVRPLRLAVALLLRALRGVPADLSWRVRLRTPGRRSIAAVAPAVRSLPTSPPFDQTNGVVDFDVPAGRDPQAAAAAAMARSATAGSLTF